MRGGDVVGKAAGLEGRQKRDRGLADPHCGDGRGRAGVRAGHEPQSKAQGWKAVILHLSGSR